MGLSQVQSSFKPCPCLQPESESGRGNGRSKLRTNMTHSPHWTLSRDTFTRESGVWLFINVKFCLYVCDIMVVYDFLFTQIGYIQLTNYSLSFFGGDLAPLKPFIKTFIASSISVSPSSVFYFVTSSTYKWYRHTKHISNEPFRWIFSYFFIRAECGFCF